MRAIVKKGLVDTTPVQAEAIPAMLEWKDVTAKAPTGTGKTFAFGIPIIEHIDPSNDQIQALILAPTRELAIQITAELRSIAMYKLQCKVVCIYGGQPIATQISYLKNKPKIVVATPGRLLDHLQRRTVKLNGVQTVVLDEADRMVDMGFYKDVIKILEKMPDRRNLVMMSATISREVMDISWLYQRDQLEITVPEDVENKPDILQYSLQTPDNAKVDAMQKIIDTEGYERSIVFCNTKMKVKRLTDTLSRRGYSVDCIHGDIRQSIREKVLQAFRKGNLSILVATDVAARGIDVDDIDTVFNYDIPDENDYYVHRIGRTGRAKKHGVAYTFVSSLSDTARLKEIVRYTKAEISPLDTKTAKR